MCVKPGVKLLGRQVQSKVLSELLTGPWRASPCGSSRACPGPIFVLDKEPRLIHMCEWVAYNCGMKWCHSSTWVLLYALLSLPTWLWCLGFWMRVCTSCLVAGRWRHFHPCFHNICQWFLWIWVSYGHFIWCSATLHESLSVCG